MDAATASQLQEVLEYLVFDGKIEKNSAAEGVARLVAKRGADRLSPGQRMVYEKYIKSFFQPECARCHSEVIECEIIGLLENGGYCSWCAKMISNDD